MSVIGSNIIAGASGQGGGYNLTNSLRLRSSASAYLSRTPASAGNRKTFTWSGWVKRGALASDMVLFGASGTTTAGTGTLFYLYYQADTLYVGADNSSGLKVQTTAVYRDPSAYYHVVMAVDTTQATSSNRVKLYVNGVQVTNFSTATYPTQNREFNVNNTEIHTIGKWPLSSDYYLDGYLTEVNFIDGQQLTPSSFGETSTTTGVWQPKRYAGTYGTNGFYLPFTDNSALTTSSNVGLGKDFSGNGNYWTTNNISITAGSTYDSMTDVPTLTSATAANYPTLNPLDTQTTSELPSSGNLNANGGNNIRATMCCPSTGKYYFEYTRTNTTDSAHVGVMSSTSAITSLTSGCILYRNDGNVYVNNSVVTTYASFTTNDVIGVGMDMDTGNIYFSKNNTYQGAVGLASAGITVGNVVPMIRNNTGATASLNFGQRPFAYTPSSGFVALNTFNLPTPTIGATASTLANKNFDALTYTGDGTSSRNITGLNFQPDFVWNKVRSISTSHALTDSVRQAPNQLSTNSTAAEVTDYYYGGVSAFLSNGFTAVAGGGGAARVNASGETYVAWNWKANGSGSSNTSGSITSTVSANTSAGFSVVTWTGNGTNPSTIGHGLGVKPSMMIVKNRTASPENTSWFVYHTTQGATKYLTLNTTNAVDTSSSVWSNTEPTSTVFTVANGFGLNYSGSTYVGYMFAEVAGYSKFGSYTGNGSTDGAFVYTGFRPRYVMIKRTDSTSSWAIFDTVRNTYNVTDNNLFANLSDAESTFTVLDILSNGFKIRTTLAGSNASGGTYIYACFAENPFKYSLAR